MTFIEILSIISIVLLVILLYNEFKRNLMMFQQNSYRPERYFKWLKNSGETTSYSRLIAIFLVLFSLAGFGLARFSLLCVSLFALIVAASLAKRKYKKPLAVTKRVIRLYFTLILILILLSAVVICASYAGLFGPVQPLYSLAVTLLICYCISFYLVFCAYFILIPCEKHINKGFYKKAVSKLNSFKDLKIIGITGSYGKTSTKHYLHRILSEEYETLMTPGSYNTTLGVVRTINEYLKPTHQVFIVEMGAKQSGDIKEICDLVKPEYGIITAVGPQHLETFKTIENVRKTKFELIDALPSDGIGFLNNDYPEIAEVRVDNCKVIRYGLEKNKNEDYTATNIQYSQNGTSFKLECPDGNILDFETPLLGKYNIANLVGAIAVARSLNISFERISYAVSKIEPVEHRLSIKAMANGVTLIDDAFNSNPKGSSMAVEVLAQMNSGRRIIITPGMIELGEEQSRLNGELGEKIANEGIDYVAIVGEYNKSAITEGLVAGGMNEDNILYFSTFLEANSWMINFVKPGDVVLIENDLPDTFK